MEDRLAVISLIISNPDSVATVNEKFHLQSSLIIKLMTDRKSTRLNSSHCD